MRKSTRTITKAILFGATLCGVAFVAPDEAKADPQTHDGFYLRLDIGLGYLSTSGGEAPFEEEFSGMGIPSSLLLGGTVGPVVIGGGFVWNYLPSPSYTLNGNDVDTSAVDISLTMVGIGMFADIYPDPKGGLHILPFVGYGGVTLSVEGNDGGNDPLGLLLGLGVGYEFWVGNEWSIGPMFKFDYGMFSIEDVDYPTIAPSLVCTFTLH